LAYQLSDIVTKVQQRVRDIGFDRTQITNFLNDAQNDVFNEYTLPFMETSQAYTVTVNVSDITNGANLPTNYAEAIDLTYTSADGERNIPYRNVTELDITNPDEDDTTEHPAGTPQYWYFYAETIRVFPVPSTAYTLLLRYYKKPTSLSADTDVPSIPSNFEELLVVGAGYRVLQVKDNYDQAGILQNKYDEILQKLVMQTAQNQIGVPVQMRINRYANGKRNF
jgi:hypothetical protein